MPWFSAHAIMYFEYTDGPQDTYLVQENVFLIQATSSQEANAKACLRAREDEGDSSGTLTVNDCNARLVFGSILKIVEISHGREDGQLADGDELTYSEYLVTHKTDLDKLLTGQDVEILLQGVDD